MSEPNTTPAAPKGLGWDFPPMPRHDPYEDVCRELGGYKPGWDKIPSWHRMGMNTTDQWVVKERSTGWLELGSKLGNTIVMTREAQQHYGGGGGGGVAGGDDRGGRGGYAGSGGRGGGNVGGGGHGPLPPGACRDYFQNGSCRFGDNCKFNHPAKQAQAQSSGSPAPRGGPPPIPGGRPNPATIQQTQYIQQNQQRQQTQQTQQTQQSQQAQQQYNTQRGRDMPIREAPRGGSGQGNPGRGGGNQPRRGGFQLGERPPSPPKPHARPDGKLWEGRGGARGGAGGRGRGRGGRGRGASGDNA